jgi:hypothetical protein
MLIGYMRVSTGQQNLYLQHARPIRRHIAGLCRAR